MVILLLAWIVSIPLHFEPLNVLGVVLVIVLFGMCISSLSIVLASLLKTRERVMGIAQAIIMPLFFASNAIYPVEIMPGWLQFLVVFNPLTYVVDALRALLVSGDYAKLPGHPGAGGNHRGLCGPGHRGFQTSDRLAV